jgi:hypothetical protein
VHQPAEHDRLDPRVGVSVSPDIFVSDARLGAKLTNQGLTSGYSIPKFRRNSTPIPWQRNRIHMIDSNAEPVAAAEALEPDVQLIQQSSHNTRPGSRHANPAWWCYRPSDLEPPVGIEPTTCSLQNRSEWNQV